MAIFHCYVSSPEGTVGIFKPSIWMSTGAAKAIDVIYLQREVEWLQQVSWISAGRGRCFQFLLGYGSKPWYLVNIKIAGKWMFIPLKMYL